MKKFEIADAILSLRTFKKFEEIAILILNFL